MANNLVFVFVAVLLFLDLTYGEKSISRSRQKRFLSTSLFTDSQPWNQGARDLLEQLSSQAMKTMDDILTPRFRMGVKIHQGPINSWLPGAPSGSPMEKTPNRELEKEDFDTEIKKIDLPEPQTPQVEEIPETSPPISAIFPWQLFEDAQVPQHPLFSFGLFTPWWKGPNICVEKGDVEEFDQDSSNFTGLNFSFESNQCVPSETAYVCKRRTHYNGIKRTMITKYYCCHGFTRRTDGRPGCSELKMDNLLDTMASFGAKRFVHTIESFNLKDKILNGNFTVFCPTDEAMMDFEDETEENEISIDRRLERRSASDKDSLVAGHIVDGFFNYGTMDNEQIIYSINEKPIRINKYQGPQPVVTANCVPVTAKNHIAKNGIVHFIPEVLSFPSKSILELINSDPQFSILKELLQKSGLSEKLKDPERTWTFFAPNDNAFMQMDQAMLEDMRNGKRCFNNTLKQHMVETILCSSAVSSRIEVQNMLENRLELTRDELEMVRVDAQQILQKDIMASNGVLHVIEAVLIPPQAQNMLEALEDADRDDLLNLIETAGLTSTFRDMENVTFFAPTKEAIQDISNESLKEWQEDSKKLRDVLLYHVVTPKTSVFALEKNKQMTSLFQDKPIHIKLEEAFPGFTIGATAQCARVMSSSMEVCGAYVHVINEVLIPSNKDILSTLESMEGFSTFYKMIQKSGLETKLRESGPLTLLAPSDEAFVHFKDEIDELMENKTKAEEIVRMHILPEMLCCRSVRNVSPFHWQYVRTFEGTLLPLHRNLQNRVRFGRARAIKCDILAENGVIHTLNKVILPSRNMMFNLGMFGIL